MTQRRVYVRAGGLICSAGESPEAVAARCLESGPIVPPRRSYSTQLGAVDLPYFPVVEGGANLFRTIALAKGVLKQAKLDPQGIAASGLFLGSSSGHLNEKESAYRAEYDSDPTSAVALRRPYIGDVAEQLAMSVGINGVRNTFSTACSASANALLYGAWMIRKGLIDHMLICGVEFANQLSILGFHGLALLAPDVSRPFDRDRAGVVLGEGMACMLLSAEADDAQWQLLGGASACDTSHPTSPDAELIGTTIAQALQDSGVQATSLVAIKAHGTGTPGNDAAESEGIEKALQLEASSKPPPPMSSIKPVFGHLLGACGVAESLVTMACLDKGLMPGTRTLIVDDPELPVTSQANATPVESGPVLCNFFGFGGNNCSLVFAPC